MYYAIRTLRQLKDARGESQVCKDTMVLVTPVNAYYTKLRKSNAGKDLNIIIRSNNQEAIKHMVAEAARLIAGVHAMYD